MSQICGIIVQKAGPERALSWLQIVSFCLEIFRLSKSMENCEVVHHIDNGTGAVYTDFNAMGRKFSFIF